MAPPLRRGALLCGSALLLGCLNPGAALAQGQGAAPAGTPTAQPTNTLLYTLATRCSLEGAAPVACSVEAVDQGGSTLYRHRIGERTIAVRITDSPVTMARQSGPGQPWEPVRTAGARFSTNSICFNGRELCVVNPNYLNSVREDRQDLRLQGRDLVKVHFGPDGRVDASCYDSGCEANLR
jgi:hypothetical protein